MEGGNKGHDLADLRAEQEREAGITSAQQALMQRGFDVCVSCGDEIEAERRAALPSAKRCIDCQQKIELNQSRRRR